MNGGATQAATIGVIGDVHLFWDDEDVAFFNRGGYDLILFVGDLAAYTQVRGHRTARSLQKLRVPAMCIPGNHDGLHAFQLGAEIAPRAHRLREAFCLGQARRCRRLADALGDIELVAYTNRRLAPAGIPLNIVVCRPHSIGGRRLACLRYLAEAYGVDSMESSIARLKSLVDACDDAPILFLAHNGPSGLGDRADSIWGCDFRRREEDWGDQDLEAAVSYANSNGRKVLAAVAGHMHRKTKSGKSRPAQVEKDGVLYVNAAEVPRHRQVTGEKKRHHVKLTVTQDGVTAEDCWV
jgi:uncharacterized protein (TIGR04168 family)